MSQEETSVRGDDVASPAVLRLARGYDGCLQIAFSLLPVVAIAYLALYQNPTLKFNIDGVHEVAITVATLMSGFITYVTWRSYVYSGEVLLRWLTMGFLGFTLVYSLHGVFTPLAANHLTLFLIYGPVSRLLLAICFMVGLLHYGKPTENPEAVRQSGFWHKGLVFFAVLSVATGLLAISPVLDPVSIPAFAAMSDWCGEPSTRQQIARYGLEGLAVVLNLLSITLILHRAPKAPLMILLAVALTYFTFSSFAFLISRPWNHQWWLAHAIFASGFMLVSWGVLQAFHTTCSFSKVFSLEHLMKELVEERTATQRALVQLRAANQQLELLATTDPLTGAANRRQILNLIDKERQRADRRGASTALLLMDIDHFKAINDSHGHAHGDAVLVAVANCVIEMLRPGDQLGRIGGEEFLVLVTETDASAANAVAERIRQRLGEITVRLNGSELRITVSIGVALFDREGLNIEAVLALADQRMYAAKNGGRNRVVGPNSGA